MAKPPKLDTDIQKARQRWWWLAQAGLALLLVYIFGLQAIDTGRLLYYFVTFGLILFSLNRIVKSVRGHRA